MVNVHIQEGWIDHDLTIRSRKMPNGIEKEYAIGSLVWTSGARDNKKRHKITLFFEDTAQHLCLTAAKNMKLHEGSRVIITGTLRSPAEEKQADGSWAKPADASMNVESITFAGGASTKKTEENSNTNDENSAKPASTNYLNSKQYAPTDTPAGFVEVPEEECLNIGDGSGLPF